MHKEFCVTCKLKSLAAQNLSKEELLELESGCALTKFKTGEIIIKQNSLSSSVAYIKTGLVKIHAIVQDKEKTLRIIKAPRYICLPSNFIDKFNHFSATAIEDTTICFLDLNIFKKFIYKNGEFAYQIILDLSKNELNNLHSFVESINKHATGRIAYILLFFAKEIYNSIFFNLPISRQDIGDLTSATRESVSRTLNDLQSDNIIKIDGKKIEIINEKLLEKISEKG
jgi:CRP/FNR family transcriptional regulator